VCHPYVCCLLLFTLLLNIIACTHTCYPATPLEILMMTLCLTQVREGQEKHNELMDIQMVSQRRNELRKR